MKRHWKKMVFAGVLAAVTVLAGCGKKDNKTAELVLLTDGSQVSENGMYASAWEGLQQYSEKQKKTCAVEVPEEKNQASYEQAVQKAVQNKAKVIICAGETMSQTVYEAQRTYRDVRFLLFEAVPKSAKGKERIRGNTESIEIDAAQAGYLAGYAAVEAGYTRLGYIGTKSGSDGAVYGTGYALGAEAAAKDLGLEAGSVELDYEMKDDASVSPAYLDQLKNWYGQGGQILFSDGSSVQNVISAAANACGAVMIQNGGVESYPNACLKVQLEYGTAVKHALTEMNADDFEGGKTLTNGVAEGEISLVWDSNVIAGFGEEQYQALCDKVTAADFSVSEGNALEAPEQFQITQISIRSLEPVT